MILTSVKGEFLVSNLSSTPNSSSPCKPNHDIVSLRNAVIGKVLGMSIVLTIFTALAILSPSSLIGKPLFPQVRLGTASDAHGTAVEYAFRDKLLGFLLVTALLGVVIACVGIGIFFCITMKSKWQRLNYASDKIIQSAIGGLVLSVPTIIYFVIHFGTGCLPAILNSFFLAYPIFVVGCVIGFFVVFVNQYSLSEDHPT